MVIQYDTYYHGGFVFPALKFHPINQSAFSFMIAWQYWSSDVIKHKSLQLLTLSTSFYFFYVNIFSADYQTVW